jgi:Cu+-exporting ATPase
VRDLDGARLDAGPFAQEVEKLQAEGQTVMFVSIDDRPAGLLGVADPLKDSTPEAVKLLRADGVEIVVVTGDSRTTAMAVARELGLDHVEAEVLPQQKSRISPWISR